MSKVAIVFWSATGNTETMANCIAEGAGANGTLVPCAEMTPAKLALFGSYGWGDGQWMRDWCERVKEDGAQLFSEEGLICNETPDDDTQAACRKLGADLANW